MLTDEEAMELMAEDMAIDLPIKHESKPYLMIPLPDGATNGDVIKALFPNATYEHINKMSGVNFTRVKGLNAFEFPQDFYDGWWNAPYKRGESE